MKYNETVTDSDVEPTIEVVRPYRFVFPIEKCALWMAAGLAVFVLCSSLWIGYRRTGWYDEVLVLTIARLPSLRSIFEAISAAASSLPPFYFVLVRFFDQVFGPSDGAVRIPSALAAAAGMFVTFDCARRFTNSLNALSAMALLTCSCLPYYSYEARPYAVCFLFSAVGLWLWSHPRGDRTWVAALFGLTFFLAFCFHYYTALILIPYVVIEALERPWLRRPSPKLIAGTAGVICGVLVCAPFMMSARKFSKGFWSPPSITLLRGTFTEVFPDVLLVAAVVLAGLALMPARDRAVMPPMLRIERLGWLFLLIPVAGFAIAMAVTNAFVSRYFIGILPGIAVAFACALWRRFHGQPAVSAAITVAMLVIGCSQQARLVALPETVKPPLLPKEPERIRQMLALEPVLLKDGKTAIVIPASAILSLEASYYSRRAKSYLFLLPAKEDMVSRAHRDLARFQPLAFWRMEDLQANAGSAALINPSGGVLGSLTEAGFRLQFIDSGSELLQVYYLNRP